MLAVLLAYIATCGTVTDKFGGTRIASQRYVDSNILANRTKVSSDGTGPVNYWKLGITGGKISANDAKQLEACARPIDGNNKCDHAYTIYVKGTVYGTSPAVVVDGFMRRNAGLDGILAYDGKIGDADAEFELTGDRDGYTLFCDTSDYSGGSLVLEEFWVRNAGGDVVIEDVTQSEDVVPSMKYVNDKFSADSMLEGGTVIIGDDNAIADPENVTFSGVVDFGNGTKYEFRHITYVSDKAVYIDGSGDFVLRHVDGAIKVCDRPAADGSARKCYDTEITGAVRLDRKFATEQFVIDNDDVLFDKIRSVIV